MEIEVSGVRITLTKDQLAEIDLQLKKEDVLVKAKQRLLEMLNGCSIRLDDKFPMSVLYDKDENILFEQDVKKRHFWCSSLKVWSIFNTEFGLNHQDIREMICATVAECLGTGPITVGIGFGLICFGGRSTPEPDL